VLDLDLGAEGFLPAGPDGDVGVAAEATLLHVRVRDVEVAHGLPQLPEERGRLGAGVHVRLRHELHQRRSGAVHIDQRVALGAVVAVEEPSGVLLEVDALEVDGLRAAVDLDLEFAAEAEGLVELGDLVALHQVRIGVVLAVELRVARNLAAEREASHQRVGHGLLVDDGEHARHAEADRTDVGVGGGIEVLAVAAAEHLRFRLELDVHFHADDGFVVSLRVSGHVCSAPGRSFYPWMPSAAFSGWCRDVRAYNRLPTIDRMTADAFQLPPLDHTAPGTSIRILSTKYDGSPHYEYW